ncbi:hypothetical protein FHX37_3416 [Haloactinospora alba]|uniref:PH (Pleckstrin Homology) domain-containing protein n=1 Tax=Haloactinospora alba TaxID=405555 RepID=A0A543NNI5_9ACTN|nr:hypothetical protein [Haloactinospora alba]TQN33401.1 hypothetical protein FHX37_3416 [Haloactinospora alba]
MSSDEYRIDNEARRGMVWLAWAQMVCGVLLFVTGLANASLVSASSSSGAAWWQYTLYAVCGATIVAVGVLNRHMFRHAHIRLRPDGIVVHEWRDRFIPWSDIAEVQTQTFMRFRTAAVTLVSGRQRRLPAPMDRIAQPDPNFPAQLETLRQWLRHHHSGQRS